MFDRVVCINLDRRADRWEQLQAELPQPWPFAPVERFAAVDGKSCPCPSWWRAGGGAWGCYRSHLAIIEDCLNRGVESVLLLEDDALFNDDFLQDWQEAVQHVPDNWGMLYLGGQHLATGKHPPAKVNEYWYRPWNVNRTHAFALRGQTMREVYKWLNEAKDWKAPNHIDHHLGRLHQKRNLPIYTPWRWLVGQSGGKSNISGRVCKERFWPSAEQITSHWHKPFAVVLGVHRSGSSCLAMCMHKLGVHMGNQLIGAEGPNGGGGEAVGLADICEKALPFPSTDKVWPEKKIINRLRDWSRVKCREATARDTIAGGKYPHLCALAGEMKYALGDRNMLVVNIDRPLDDSIASILKRHEQDDIPRGQLIDLQEWLYGCKELFLAENEHLTVNYYDLMREPERELRRLVEYLQLDATGMQFEEATQHVQRRFDSPQAVFRDAENPLEGVLS